MDGVKDIHGLNVVLLLVDAHSKEEEARQERELFFLQEISLVLQTVNISNEKHASIYNRY